MRYNLQFAGALLLFWGALAGITFAVATIHPAAGWAIGSIFGLYALYALVGFVQTLRHTRRQVS